MKEARLCLESGALDHSAILTVEKSTSQMFHMGKTCIIKLLEKNLAERSFDLRTSGLWAQHASTAPLCYLQSDMVLIQVTWLAPNPWRRKIALSEVGFEPTPTEVDCDLNAAP